MVKATTILWGIFQKVIVQRNSMEKSTQIRLQIKKLLFWESKEKNLIKTGFEIKIQNCLVFALF
jgi:hypothetical protein